MGKLKAVLGWLNVDPVSGSGNSQVSVSTEAVYKGRNMRQTVIQVVGTGVETPENVTVKQQGEPEYVDIQATAAVPSAGGSLTITGVSNSTKLTFELTAGAENPLTLELPATYTAGGASTANGAVISGDPGATGEYNFSVVFPDIPANATLSALISSLKVTANGGQTDTVVITQAAGDPALSVSTNEIILDASGSVKTFNVISNTAWTIKQSAPETPEGN